jgi:hypothetical protein
LLSTIVDVAWLLLFSPIQTGATHDQKEKEEERKPAETGELDPDLGRRGSTRPLGRPEEAGRGGRTAGGGATGAGLLNLDLPRPWQPTLQPTGIHPHVATSFPEEPHEYTFADWYQKQFGTAPSAP